MFGVIHFRMELQREEFARWIFHRRHRAVVGSGRGAEPFRHAFDRIAVAHPGLERRAGKDRGIGIRTDFRAAVFALREAATFPPSERASRCIP